MTRLKTGQVFEQPRIVGRRPLRHVGNLHPGKPKKLQNNSVSQRGTFAPRGVYHRTMART